MVHVSSQKNYFWLVFGSFWFVVGSFSLNLPNFLKNVFWLVVGSFWFVFVSLFMFFRRVHRVLASRASFRLLRQAQAVRRPA